MSHKTTRPSTPETPRQAAAQPAQGKSATFKSAHRAEPITLQEAANYAPPYFDIGTERAGANAELLIPKKLGISEGDISHVMSFRVDGDGMAPTINDNAVVVIDMRANNLATMQEGKIYIIYVEGRPMIKRLRWAEPGQLLALCADNKTCATIFCRVEKVRLAGRAIVVYHEI